MRHEGCARSAASSPILLFGVNLNSYRIVAPSSRKRQKNPVARHRPFFRLPGICMGAHPIAGPAG